MNQNERLIYLINYLLNENNSSILLPESEREQRDLLRALMNVRPPSPISLDFLKIQDEFLGNDKRDIVSLSDLDPVSENIFLWQGDITSLKVDAIVNAANNSLLGCFIPGHNCIDNAIHSAAGIQLRLECAELMQGRKEITGNARLTGGWNLPAKYIIHTIGPIVGEYLTRYDCLQLQNCYKACLNLAIQYKLDSIAFCCISTGVFNFPNEEAAKIAIKTVRNFLRNNEVKLQVIFNVFKNEDFIIYKKLLSSSEICE